MRISSIQNEERKDRLDLVPIFKKGTRQPASLHSNNIGISTLQKEFCCTTYVEGMPWHLRKASGNPHYIAMVNEPSLYHGHPTPVGGLKGEEQCSIGNERIGREVVAEGRKWTCSMVMSHDGDISTCLSSGFSPWNMKGSMFCTIMNLRGTKRDDVVGDMFGRVRKILTRDEKFTQLAT